MVVIKHITDTVGGDVDGHIGGVWECIENTTEIMSINMKNSSKDQAGEWKDPCFDHRQRGWRSENKRKLFSWAGRLGQPRQMELGTYKKRTENTSPLT